MTAGPGGELCARLCPSAQKAHQLGVRDGLRPVTERAAAPPAGLPVDERTAEEHHQAQRLRLFGESRLKFLEFIDPAPPQGEHVETTVNV
jgi:hypothetical protein